MGILLSGSAGAGVARRLILAPVAVPLVLGLVLRVIGERGGGYRAELSAWLFSLANITVFTLVIWWSARVVHRADTGRSRAEEEVAQRRRAEEALTEADRRKDEFLAMLAHELRNPLAPIRNAVGLMRLTGVADPRLSWCRDVIDRQVAHLSRLVDDLLDVSRVTRGLIHLRSETVELAAVVNQAAETVRPMLEERRHVLAVALPAQPVCLRGDPTRLAQVFGNLLHNAAKFSDDGGRIALTAAREGGRVVVRVRDSGVGMAAEVLPHIFEPFTQGDRSLDRAQGGLGVGLTLVRRLVELHGGTVEAHSDGPGKGSEFVVRLAEAPAPAAPSPDGRRAPAAGPSPGGRRVLVVDDNGDAAESLALLLRLAGHEARVAHDGPGALKEAEAFPPDAVLLDIGLPGMDGYEVARRLRRLEGARSATLVAVTGYGQDDDLRRSKEAGFDHHLIKPVDPSTLYDLLRAR
jgi:signal transduction histidine kinase